jgi:two-component system, OmpR family, sensor kinase
MPPGMHKLRRRIYAHLLVTLLVGVIASAIVLTAGWRTALLHSFAARLTHHVASQLSDRWSDRPAFARELARTAEELDVEITVRAASDGGRLIAAAGAPYPPLDGDELARVRKNDIVVERHPRFFVAAPLVVDGKIVAVVQAAPPIHAFRLPTRPIITIVLILVIAGVASGPLARRISLPIERMTDAMRRFGAGDLGARVPPPSRVWLEKLREHRGRSARDERFARRFERRMERHFERQARRHQLDEIEQLTRAFNEMAERIEQLVRGQKELLANVSHELRSPLARIRVALELASPRDEKSAARLKDVEDDIAELDRLIEDVLTTSRLEATGLPAHVGSVDIAEMFAALVARAQVDPTTAGKEVRAEPADGVTLVADAALIKRALWNLVENAAKYGAPPIVLSAAADGDAVELRVADSGGGIAPEDRQRIFEPFYRADKARTPGRGGFGLGLTLARKVAEVHGGTIRAEGDHGAVIIIRLPRG